MENIYIYNDKNHLFVVPYIIKRKAWLQIYNFNFEKKKKNSKIAECGRCHCVGGERK